MKVAVIFSGQYRGNVDRNLYLFSLAFPNYDFYFTAWENSKITDPNIVQLKEPEDIFPAYEFDLEKQRYVHNTPTSVASKKGWCCKQHLGHALAVEMFGKGYDMIVRARYDCVINPEINWEVLVQYSFYFKTIIGIGPANSGQVSTSKGNLWKRISNPDPFYGFIKWPDKWPHFGHGLSDVIILHPPSMIDVNRVTELYEKELLRENEFGWWQILVEENRGSVHYTKDPTLNYRGGVILDRNYD